MKRAIIVISDGLWSGELSGADCQPLDSLFAGMTRFANHRGVVPSVTRVSAASIATGASPAEHGLFGNRVVLRTEGGHLEMRDVGKPEFFPELRSLKGKILDVPTLAECVAPHGLFLACSNVSPGAAYVLDPEHKGFVFHRAGSFGPGGRVLEGDDSLQITKGPSGDAAMTERFINELRTRQPIFSVLWLGEPDTSLHLSAPASDIAQAGLRSACLSIESVYEEVLRMRAAGDDVLFIVGSDHGMDPCDRLVNIKDELYHAGLAGGWQADSLVLADNGGSALIALETPNPSLISAIVDFLKSRPWAAEVYANHGKADATLESIGLKEDPCLSIFVNAAACGELSPQSGRALRWGFSLKDAPAEFQEIGMHGYSSGLSLSPYLAISGKGFPAGHVSDLPSSLLNIAPTVLSHLGIGRPSSMAAESLQTYFSQGGQS